MSFERRGQMPLDYEPVAYAGSVLRFRGPERDIEDPFIACLGGSETFGRFIHAPFAVQLDQALDVPVLNLGVMNAGLDVITKDPAIVAKTEEASAIILQITGAQNMTNRFYSVHPRRNDRFLKASSMLKTVYRDVDFTEFHFTRHLLTHLNGVSSDRFGVIVSELRAAWLSRMKRFLNDTVAPVHLLWIANHPPGAGDAPAPALDHDPLFVTDQMLEDLAPEAASLTIATPGEGSLQSPTQGMFFAAREEAAARILPRPAVHDTAAAQLRPLLQGLHA